MTAYAPSRYQLQNPGELSAPQLTIEEIAKLQEIHELINLLLREMPVAAQVRSATMSIIPAAVPYTYSILRFPCG